jgi:hypothetical protein
MGKLVAWAVGVLLLGAVLFNWQPLGPAVTNWLFVAFLLGLLFRWVDRRRAGITREPRPPRCSACGGSGRMVISEKQMGTCPVCSGGSWR